MANSEYFIKFVKYFKSMQLLKKIKPELVLDSYGIQEFDDEGKQFYSNINDGISNARVFEIGDDLKRLLALTDTPSKNDEIHIPFDIIFLDANFTKEELANLGIEIECNEIIGILAREGKLTNNNKIVGKDLNMTMLSQQGTEFWFDTFNKNANLSDDYKKQNQGMNIKVYENPTTDKKARDFVHKFFLNFINFLNNPEVIYTEHKRSEANLKRKLKKNKIIIPATCSVTVNGKLKVYLDEIASGNGFEYSYRFWIRGHFRDLVADRWVYQRRIWIFPYIRGKKDGILIEKSYEVELKP